MTEIRCRPIDTWEGDRTPWEHTRAAPFRVQFHRLIAELGRELAHLDASDVTIGLDLASHQIRADGWPNARASVPYPVSLVFQSKHGPLRYQCDRWERWQDNLRAIGLTLHRLRLVEDAGVVKSGEQYRGWAQLPPATIQLGSGMTYEQAQAIVWNASGMTAMPDTGPLLDQAWKHAAKHHHPDVGGDHDEWVRIEQAFRVLRGG